MDTQTIIEYEVIDPVSNKSFFTKTYDDAVDYFGKDYMVYEIHTTICNPTPKTQSKMIVTIAWHINPRGA